LNQTPAKRGSLFIEVVKDSMQSTLMGRVADLLEMIKFSHTIFALPFALTGLILASGGLPSPYVLAWVIVAMVGARTCAMAFNRIADTEIDAKNPRTAERHLPSGRIASRDAWVMTIAGALLMVFAAWMLNPLCLMLSPLALIVLFLYPYTKRFTALCHYVLGLALAAAPLGAWIAVTGEFSLKPLPLALAVLLWVAGFDVFYALQDLDFDSEEGLHSIPAKLGVKGALKLAAKLHIAMFLLLVSQLFIFNLGLWYIAGMALVGYLLFYEHALVTPNDLSRLDAAFFNMNGIISVVVFVATLTDVTLGGGW